MVWGKFDGLIVAILPAKDLRARVRAKDVVAASDEYKAPVLKRAIPELLQDHARPRDPPTRRSRAPNTKRATLQPDPSPEIGSNRCRRRVPLSVVITCLVGAHPTCGEPVQYRDGSRKVSVEENVFRDAREPGRHLVTLVTFWTRVT